MLILRESNGRDWCHSGLSENPTSLRQLFSTQMDTALRCSLNRLGFYSLRKETASVKAAESISFRDLATALLSWSTRTTPDSHLLPLDRMVGFSLI